MSHIKPEARGGSASVEKLPLSVHVEHQSIRSNELPSAGAKPAASETFSVPPAVSEFVPSPLKSGDNLAFTSSEAKKVPASDSWRSGPDYHIQAPTTLSFDASRVGQLSRSGSKKITGAADPRSRQDDVPKENFI